MKRFIFCIFIFALGFMTSCLLTKCNDNRLDNEVMYKVKITQDFINVRPKIDLNTDIMKQVFEGEEYEVIEYYEGNQYNWYKIRYGTKGRLVGWIASGKKNAWVEVIEK